MSSRHGGKHLGNVIQAHLQVVREVLIKHKHNNFKHFKRAWNTKFTKVTYKHNVYFIILMKVPSSTWKAMLKSIEAHKCLIVLPMADNNYNVGE